MVRILKIKELQVKKRELLVRSEIHRQTLALEMTNVKLAVSLIKKRMGVLKTVYRLLGVAVPIGGLLFGRKQPEQKQGFLSRLLSGINLAGRIKSFFNGAKTANQSAEQTEDSSRF